MIQINKPKYRKCRKKTYWWDMFTEIERFSFQNIIDRDSPDGFLKKKTTHDLTWFKYWRDLHGNACWLNVCFCPFMGFPNWMGRKFFFVFGCVFWVQHGTSSANQHVILMAEQRTSHGICSWNFAQSTYWNGLLCFWICCWPNVKGLFCGCWLLGKSLD